MIKLSLSPISIKLNMGELGASHVRDRSRVKKDLAACTLFFYFFRRRFSSLRWRISRYSSISRQVDGFASTDHNFFSSYKTGEYGRIRRVSWLAVAFNRGTSMNNSGGRGPARSRKKICFKYERAVRSPSSLMNNMMVKCCCFKVHVLLIKIEKLD